MEKLKPNKSVGFNEKDQICKDCTGYGNQLFRCSYCENHDHFGEKEKLKN